MFPTSPSALRDRAIVLLGALAPRDLPGNRFTRSRDEGVANFVEWATANPASAFRRFQVRIARDEPSNVGNTDAEERQLALAITVAYPTNARTGPAQALDRDATIERDAYGIDVLLGVYGRANFAPPAPDATPLGVTYAIERGGAVDFLTMEAVLTYQRLIRL